MNSIYEMIGWRTLNSPAAAVKIARGTLAQLDRQMNSITRSIVTGAKFEDSDGRNMEIAIDEAKASGNIEALNKAYAELGQAAYVQHGTQPAPTEPVDIEGAIKKQLAALLKEAGFKVPEPKEAK